MTGDPLPDHDHVGRYCRPGTVVDGSPSPASFMPRPGEEYLSVNWIEFFGARNIEAAVDLMRDVVRVNLRLRENGRLAVVNVGAADLRVRAATGGALRVEHLPLPADASHAAIYVSDANQLAISIALSESVSPANVHAALEV